LISLVRKTIKRVTVVQFGVYDGGSNCFGGVKVKVGTDTKNMKINNAVK